ncbi:MAG: hypothetical protein AABZ53_14560 [Planctomycetota bacterium]
MTLPSPVSLTRPAGAIASAIAALIAALIAAAGHAQTISFDNSCGTLLWQSSCQSFTPPDQCFCYNNWNTGTVVTPECSACPNEPGPADSVFIGNFIVENNTTADIANLTTSVLFRNTGGLLVSGSALYQGPVTSTGYFGGTGIHEFLAPVSSNGSANAGLAVYWPARAHFYDTLDIIPGGTIYIYSETFNHDLCTWRSSGTESFFIDASGGGGELSVFRNLQGATLLATDNGTMRGITAVGHLENRGLFQKDGGTGETTITCEFKNRPTGVIDIRTGTLKFDVYGNFEGSAQIASNTSLLLTGSYAFPSTFSSTGQGLFILDGGTLSTAPGATATFARLDLRSSNNVCNLYGSGAIHVTTAASLSGRWHDAGTMNLLPACQTQINSNILELQNNFTLNNHGTLTWTMPGIAIAAGGSLNNLAGATLEITGTHAMGGYGFSGDGTLNNAGLMRKSAGDRTEIALPFVNTGRIECIAGRLAFVDFRQTAGETVLMGGVIDADYQQDPLRIEGGRLSGNGIVRGPLLNVAGTVSPGDSAGTITLAESFYGHGFTQGPGGTLDIEIGGDLPGSGYDQLLSISNHSFLNDIHLDGTLRVRLINGYAPSSGTFDVVLRQGIGTMSGTFATLDAPPGFTVEYLSDRVRLHYNATCAADFDGDGTVDFFDYDAFVNCFEALYCPPNTTADFDGDATVDFFDYDAFVVAFETPC